MFNAQYLASGAGGAITSSPEDPTLTWTFNVTYEIVYQYPMYWNIAKKPSAEFLSVTWQWTDGDGEHTIVEDGYGESTITTQLDFTPTFDTPVTMTFSDKNAVHFSLLAKQNHSLGYLQHVSVTVL